MKEKNKVSRRGFLGTGAAAAAAITVLPSNTIAGLGHQAPSDKLNIAAVGIGGMGHGNLKNLKSDQIHNRERPTRLFLQSTLSKPWPYDQLRRQALDM